MSEIHVWEKCGRLSVEKTGEQQRFICFNSRNTRSVELIRGRYQLAECHSSVFYINFENENISMNLHPILR